MIGHTGVDVSCGFGTPITSVFSGIAYKVLTKENPANDGSGFTGVFQIVDNGIECFEWLTGHCDPSVQEGSLLFAGGVLGAEANHGLVYSGGVLVTLAQQNAGSTSGSHRHYQKRPIMPVKQTSGSYKYLSRHSDSPAGTVYYSDGFYYQIFNYNNGFHGCIDPMTPTFSRDLFIGTSGYDVFVLQRILRKYGFLSAEPTAFFGPLTATALARYQLKNGITPTSYFGPRTRSVALKETMPLPRLI